MLRGMSTETDPQEVVIAELKARTGRLPAIAKDSGIPYDTLLRIRNRESDPGYSKIRRLCDHLRIRVTAIPPHSEA